ncbi:MAG: multidrug ABC transporter substrate-binding protein [Acidobacteria bacterium RIFCSPLOWO2_02_FULL_60_20]|nr:MAG: multidrug ABC transporter substrate-binding protein [Acidobacteria bacterium RIFCSPLOWO2_02_FULL_60_20]
MKHLTILKVALRALARNKLRSALTLLGMVFGVGAVIAMVSLGQGAQKMVQDQIQSVGTNLLFVQPGSRNTGGAQTGAGFNPTLTAEDIDAIAQEIPVVLAASPMVNNRSQLIFGNQNWQTQLVGTNEYAPEVRSWKMAAGEFFNDGDVKSANRVIVLGKTVADNLFQGIDPIGQSLRVRNLPFRVVGVLEGKGQSAMGQDQDDLAVIPYTTAQKKLRRSPLLWIDNAMVVTSSPLASRVAETQIGELLRQRHNLRPGDPDDFQVRNLTDVAQAAEQVTTILTLFLGSIAAVSLLVGGIGIMNIMLVSVTERTREIGIRMAVGARAGQIRMQFLTESVVLSLAGGAIGILFGAALAVAISRVMGWPVLVSSLAVIVSFAFSAAVGVFFGYYPAHRAASLDPIEALRYE